MNSFAKILSLILFVFIGTNLNAQGFNWAKDIGDTLLESGKAIVADNYGNVYMAGEFDGKVILSNGNQIDAGCGAIFIAKYNMFGDLIDAVDIGDQCRVGVESMGIDGIGNIYFTGSFNSSVDFNPNGGGSALISKGGKDIYICKLDSQLNYKWSRNMGSGSDDFGYDIFVDQNGNTYLTGSFKGQAEFPVGPTSPKVTSKGSSDVFLCKFNSNASLEWVYSWGGTALDIGRAVIVDAQGNIYTTGRYGSTVDFDPKSGVSNMVAASSAESFVSKLNPHATFDIVFDWAKKFEGTGSFGDGNAIAVDDSSNVYVAGSWEGILDFNPHPTLKKQIPSGGLEAMYLVKLSESGNFRWVRTIGESSLSGNTQVNCGSVIIDEENDIHLIFDFSETMDIDPGTAVRTVNPTRTDVVYIEIDPLGNTKLINHIEGGYYERAGDILIDPSNSFIYTTGTFGNTPDFDPSDTSVFNITTNFQGNAFISSYSLRPKTPQICIIDVNPNTGNPEVVWEKPSNQGILDKYVIHREVGTNVYVPVDSLNFSELSLYEDRDPNVNTFNREYTYKLSVINNQGVESLLSNPHTTAHISLTPGVPGTYSLDWTNYVGNFNYTDVTLWRYSNTNGLDSLDFIKKTITQYNDNFPGVHDTLFYIVSVRHPTGCTATEAVGKNSGRSNRGAMNDIFGSVTYAGKNDAVKLKSFPNPSSDYINIEFNSPIITPVTIQVLASDGKIIQVWEQELGEGNSIRKIDIRSLNKGYYYLKVDWIDGSGISKFLKL